MDRLIRFKPFLTLFSLLFAVWVSAGCTIATIRPLDPVTGKAIIGDEDQQFNAARYVTGFWDTEMTTALQENANDFDTVVTALRENQARASEEYGRRCHPRWCRPAPVRHGTPCSHPVRFPFL